MTEAHTENLLKRTPTGLLVPVRQILDNEEIALGFKQEMVDIGDGVGRVLSGAGLGSDYLILRWHEHAALVRGHELLKSWVFSHVDVSDGNRIPGELVGAHHVP